MGFRFIPNPNGIDDLGRSPGIARLVDSASERVLEAARADSQADNEYRRKLDRSPAEPTSNGMTGRVYTSSSLWHLFEFGSIHNPPYRILSRAVTAAGLKFRDGR